MIASGFVSVDVIMRALDSIIFTPEEKHIIDTIKLIDPEIERIATRSHKQAESNKNKIIVKKIGLEQQFPLSSMGDGLWHLLSLSTSLVQAKNKILLVDEIDTGLHYTVMEDMWRLVLDTAERLDVQVFATTHNSDCWTSLAAVIQERAEQGQESDAMIHRIEKGAERSVAFTSHEIMIAAERGIEVR